MEGLRLHKLADQSDGDRVAVTHPLTGDRALYTPEDADTLNQRLAAAFDGIEPTPYPFAGLAIDNEDGAPEDTQIPTQLVSQGLAEGWLSTTPAEGDLVVRSAGPKDNPWGTAPHTFIHYAAITFHTVGGDYVYDVVANPDKWPETMDGKAGFGGEVRHFYELHLNGVHEPEAAQPDEAGPSTAATVL